jgi:ectoine hydrolase
MPPFDTGEYESRVRRTKAAMAERGIDTLISSSPGNMNWLTGYDGWSFYVHQMAVTALKLERPLWVGRGLDLAGARLTCWLRGEDLEGYPDDYLQSDDNHPMSFCADVLRARGLDRGRIAVEMDDWYFTGLALDTLRRELPDAEIVDAKFLVDWVRIVKSSAEIAVMEDASRIAERVMQAAIDAIRPGVRQCDAVAEVYAAQMRGTEQFGGDYPACAPAMPMGEMAAAPHFTWTDAKYETGTATNMELAGCRHRYHSAICRTVQLGPAPDRMADLAKLVGEAFEASLDAIKPGVTCEDVAEACQAVFRRGGHEKPTRMGYAIGLNYPPDWGERTASMRAGERTVLTPGMAFHVIPALWLDDWGYILSETVVVTETGCRSLVEFPRKLFVKT